jgi:hypothetical protein
MEFLSLLFSSPLKGLNGFLALLNLILVVYFFFKILPETKIEKLVKIENSLNFILLICLLMILTVITDIFIISRAEWVLIGHRNFHLTPGGISLSIIKLCFHSALISSSLIAWFLLREFNISKTIKVSKS